MTEHNLNMFDVFKIFLSNPKDFQKLNSIDLDFLKDLLISINLECDDTESETFQINKIKLSLGLLKIISLKNFPFNFEIVLKVLLDKAINLIKVKSARSYIISMLLKIIEDDPPSNDKYLVNNRMSIQEMNIQLDDYTSVDIKDLLRSIKEGVANKLIHINLISTTQNESKQLISDTSISSNMLQEALLNFQHKANNSILKISKGHEFTSIAQKSSQLLFNKVLMKLLRDSCVANVIIETLDSDLIITKIISEIITTGPVSLIDLARNSKEIYETCYGQMDEISTLLTLLRYCGFEVQCLDQVMCVAVSVVLVSFVRVLNYLDSYTMPSDSIETVLSETIRFINDFTKVFSQILIELHLKEPLRMFTSIKVLAYHQFVSEAFKKIHGDETLEQLRTNGPFMTLSGAVLETILILIADVSKESHLDWQGEELMTKTHKGFRDLLSLMSCSSKYWLCLLLKADDDSIIKYWLENLYYSSFQITKSFMEPNQAITLIPVTKTVDHILYVDEDEGPGDTEEFGLDHLFTDYQEKSKLSVSETTAVSRQESTSRTDDQRQLLRSISDTLRTMSLLLINDDPSIKDLIQVQFDESMLDLVIRVLIVIDQDVMAMKEVFCNSSLFALVGQFINLINLLFSGIIKHDHSLHILSLLSINIETDIDQVSQSYMNLNLGPLILLVLMNISILYTNTLSGQVSPSTSWLTSDKYIKLMWRNMLDSMKYCITTNNTKIDDVNQELLQFLLLIFHGLTSINAKTEMVVSLVKCITECSTNNNCLQPRLIARLLLMFNYMMHHFYEQAPNLAYQLQFNLLTKFLNDSLNREVASYQYEELQMFNDGTNAIFYDVTVPWPVSRKNWPGSNQDTILLKQIQKDQNYDIFFAGIMSAIQIVVDQRPVTDVLQKESLLCFASSFYGLLSNWRLMDIMPMPGSNDVAAMNNESGRRTFVEMLYDMKLRRSYALSHLLRSKLVETDDDVQSEVGTESMAMPDMSKYVSRLADDCLCICEEERNAEQWFQADLLIVAINYVLLCARDDQEVKKESDRTSMMTKCYLSNTVSSVETDHTQLQFNNLLTKILSIYHTISRQLETFLSKFTSSSLLCFDLSSITKINVEPKLEAVNFVSLRSLTTSLDKFFDKWSMDEGTGLLTFSQLKKILTNKSFDSSLNGEYGNVVEMLRAEAHRRYTFVVEQARNTGTTSTTIISDNVRISLAAMVVLIGDLRECLTLIESHISDLGSVPEDIQIRYLDLVILGSVNTLIPSNNIPLKLAKVIPGSIFCQVMTKNLINIISELAKTGSFTVSQCHYDVMITSIDCLTQILDQIIDLTCLRQLVTCLTQRSQGDQSHNNITVIFTMIFADPGSIPISIKCCLLRLVNLILYRYKEAARTDETLAQVLEQLHREIHSVTLNQSGLPMRQRVERWLVDVLEDTNMARVESRSEYLSQVILLAQLLSLTSADKDQDSNFSIVIIKSILHLDDKIRSWLTEYQNAFKSGFMNRLPLINLNVVIEVLCTVSNGYCPISLYVTVIQTLLDWIKEINRCLCCYIDNNLSYDIHMDILCTSLTRIHNHIGAVICALNDQYQTEDSHEKQLPLCHKEPLHSQLYLNSFTMSRLSIDKRMIEDILFCSGNASPYSSETDQVSESEEENKPMSTNLLNEQLCTFAATQKEFTEQHWYHCYTCSMIENEGVCTVCAKVCHGGHDLSYAKRGSFFCDCGAKGSPMCEALVRRTGHVDGLGSSRKFLATSKIQAQTTPLDMSKKELLQSSRMQMADKTKYSGMSPMNKPSKYSPMDKSLRKSLKTDTKTRSSGATKTSDTTTPPVASANNVSTKNVVSGPPSVSSIDDGIDADQLQYRLWITNTLRKKLLSDSETLTVLLDTSTLLDDCFSALKTINGTFKTLYSDWVVGKHKKLKDSFSQVRSFEKTNHRVKTIIGSSLLLRNSDGQNDLSGIPPTSALASELSGANTQVRNMLQSGYVRRNVIAVVSPSIGSVVSDQYFLAVAQDKARIVIYKVSSLLEELYENAVKINGGNDDGRRQELGRVSTDTVESRQGLVEQVCTATVTFTVLSLCANPANHQYMAVCGLKEAVVLIFTAMGSVSAKTQVTPVLEDSNQFIVRSLWLPGTVTYLVLVLTQSVQIFDLASSTTQPLYHFKSVESRFKDATFAFIVNQKTTSSTIVDNAERDCYVFVMSESGCIHCKRLDKDCQGSSGFYLAEMLDWNPELYNMNRDIKTGVLGKGGASIHYDHSLQLLIHSYNNGQTFCSVLESGADEIYVDKNYFIDIKSDTDQVPILVDWASNIDHPGLLTAVCQQSNVPLFLSVEPDKYCYQFLDTSIDHQLESGNGLSDIPPETTTKVTDAVTISWRPSHTRDILRQSKQRHEQYTFSLVLFNDGKIKILIANHSNKNTDGQFWLQDRFTNNFLADFLRGTVPTEQLPKKHTQKCYRRQYQKRHCSNDDIFLDDPSCGRIPIDFFEHCEPTKEVSFGGDRFLELYSQDVLNARLLSQEQSVTVACKNPVSIIITNKDSDSLIVGLRIGINVSDLGKVPKYFEIYNRKILLPENLTRNRIVDIGLYKPEILLNEKSLILTMGPSKNPNDMIVIDFIKVFIRSKQSLLWLNDKHTFVTSRDYFAPKKQVVRHSFIKDIGAVVKRIADSRHLEPESINSHLPDPGLMSSGLQLLTAFCHFKNTLSVEGKPTFSSSELTSSPAMCSFANDLLCAFYPAEVTMNAVTLLACVNAMRSLETGQCQQESVSRVSRTSQSILASLAATLFADGSAAISKIKDEPYNCGHFLSIEAHVIRLAHLIHEHNLWITSTTTEDNDKHSALSHSDIFDLATICIDLITRYHSLSSQVRPRIGGDQDSPDTMTMMIASNFINPVYCQRLDYLPALIPYIVKAMLTYTFASHADHTQSALFVRVKLTDLIISLLVTSNLLISHNTRKSLNKFLKMCDRSVYDKTCQSNYVSEKSCDSKLLTEDGFPGPTEKEIEKIVMDVVNEEAKSVKRILAEQCDIEQQNEPDTALAFMEESQQLSLLMQENVSQEPYHDNDHDDGEVEENEYFCPAELDWMVAVSNSDSNSMAGGNIANDALMFLMESASGAPMPELMEAFDEQSMVDYTTIKNTEEEEDDEEEEGPNDDNAVQAGQVPQTDTSVTTATTEVVSHDDIVDDQQSTNNTQGAAVIDTWIINKQSAQTPKIEQLSTPDREYSDSNSGSDIACDILLKGIDQNGPRTEDAPQNDMFMTIQKFGHHFLRQVCEQWSQLIGSTNGVCTVALFKSLLDVLRHMDMRAPDAKNLVEQLLVLMLELVFTENGLLFSEESDIDRRNRNELVCIVLRALLNLVTSASTTRMVAPPSSKEDNNSTAADIKPSVVSLQSMTGDSAEFIALKLMHEKHLMMLCLSNLEEIVPVWRTRMAERQTKTRSKESDGSHSLPQTMIRVDSNNAPMTRGWLPDTEEDHSLQLCLVEILLRLPYSVLKLCRATIKDKKTSVGDQGEFLTELANEIQKENKWHSILCEFIELSISDGVTKASRTLLNSVVGAKHYRTVRDIHLIGGSVNRMKTLLDSHNIDRNSTVQVRLPFQDTLKLLELVDCCLVKAKERPANWKVYCTKCPDILKFLMAHSISLDQSIALKLLFLLQLALLDTDTIKTKKDTGQLKASVDKEKSSSHKNPATSTTTTTTTTTNSSSVSKQESKLCRVLASKVEMTIIVEFVRLYLCEYDNAGVRWLAEVIIASLFTNGKASFRNDLVDMLADLWPSLRLSPQLADLTGHMIAKHPQWERLDQFSEHLAASLAQAGQDLLTHHSTPFYSYLQRLARLPGYYLDNEPCSYCPPSSGSNDLRVYRWHSEPPDNRRNQARAATIAGMGLHSGSSSQTANAANSDYLAPNVRASPTIHVFNLRAPYAIQSLSIKFSCPRRQRPQCAITVYYSDISTVSTTQMLEQAHLWNKVRTVTITKDMAEVKLDFPVLLTAVYLIFEYDSFSATTTGSDSIKCPRCHSATIQGNVCLNCRDNINQCYHCRAINYAGIDSFICSNCSSCRYARIDFSMNAKPCYDFVEDLKSEESRDHMINRINIWSDTVDKNYQEMTILKQELEGLLDQVKMTDASEIPLIKKTVPMTATSGATGGSSAATKLIITGNRTYADVTGGASLDDTGLQNRLYRRVRRPAGADNEPDNKIEATKPGTVAPGASEPSKEDVVNKETEHGKVVHDSLQQLVLKYTNEAKEQQIEMSCLWRQVWAAKKAVAKYDARLSLKDDIAVTGQRRTSDQKESQWVSNTMGHNRHSCYKCLLSKVQQIVWLLRGLSSVHECRDAVIEAAINNDLLTLLLGPLIDAVPSWLREEIIPMLIQVTLDRSNEISRLNTIITGELLSAMKAPILSVETETRVKTILTLLRSSIACLDNVWELRLRPSIAVLQEAANSQGSLSDHCGKLLVAPCVSMLQVCMRYIVITTTTTATSGKTTSTSKKTSGQKDGDATDQSNEDNKIMPGESMVPVIDIRQWLSTDQCLFTRWTQSTKAMSRLPPSKTSMTKTEMIEHKYLTKWIKYKNRGQLRNKDAAIGLVDIDHLQVTQSWLWQALLAPTIASSRQLSHLVIDMLAYQSTERHRLILSVLVQCLPSMVAGVGADCADLVRLCGRIRATTTLSLTNTTTKITCPKYDLVSSNEAITQYVLILKRLSHEKHWRCYLVVKCRLIELLAMAITKVLEALSRTEEACLINWRWSQSVPGLVQGGWAAIHLLKNLTELLQHLQEQPAIGSKHRSTIVRCLLTASLNLRRLVVFRSKTTTDMETRFNKTVDDLSKDTEDIIRSFIKTAVDVLKQFPVTDLQSAGHIIERINAYVCPRDYEHPVFEVILDIFKGQEDFLPHRMIGVSLNCHQFGRNPTVNDVINFLVRENGVTSDIRLDLICDKKVLMYDLLLEDIYQHVWLKADAGNKTRAMRLTVRISGLVEDNLPYLENLRQDVPIEHYRRSDELIDGGLHTIMQRLAAVDQLPHGFNVIASSVKLLNYFTNVPGNDACLIGSDLGTVRVLLHCLLVCLRGGLDEKRMTEYEEATVVPLIDLLVRILVLGRGIDGLYDQDRLKREAGDCSTVRALIASIDRQSRLELYQRHVTKIPSLLLFDDEDKMAVVLDYVVPHLRTLIPDATISDDQRHTLLACCQLMTAIPADHYGDMFRHQMLHRGLLQICIDFLVKCAPDEAMTMDDCKLDLKRPETTVFLEQPALQLVLVLGRACVGDKGFQEAGRALLAVPGLLALIHKLETVKSVQAIGVLSEDWLNGLEQCHEDVRRVICEARQRTVKNLRAQALKVRQRQLSDMKMTVNDKGQVLTSCSMLKDLSSQLLEEPGHSCAICMDGHVNKPQEALGVYTYVKKVLVHDLMSCVSLVRPLTTSQGGGGGGGQTTVAGVPGGIGGTATAITGSSNTSTAINQTTGTTISSTGATVTTTAVATTAMATSTSIVPASVPCASQYYYSSVSNYVCVHFSCHNQAVKVVNENEWIVAQRHNQNAKCNSLLPIMGPQHDPQFKSNLNRYQTSIWNNTNVPEINYQLIVHDLKFLLLRFAQGRQFNEDTGGGARLSNMRLLPQIVQISLANLLSQTDLVTKETQALTKWLEQAGGWSKWFSQNMWQSTNVPYRVVQSLIFQSRDSWTQTRLTILKILLQFIHLRHYAVTDVAALQSLSLEPLPFSVYQPMLVLYGLMHLIYTVYWKNVPSSSAATGKVWMEALSLYIRDKEVTLLDDSTRMVRQYEDDLLPCDSIQEWWDVVDLGQVMPYDDDFLVSVLQEIKDIK